MRSETRSAAGRVGRWWFPEVPAGRIAALRAAVYLFVMYDMFFLVNDVVPHGYAPPELYQPLLIPRLLHLPAPTPYHVHALQAILLVSTLVAATGRLPRIAGWVTAFAFLDWMFIGMSYGKVDHDHLALVVALFVLPTVPRRRWSNLAGDELVGWALRCIQVAVVATYFLSCWGKVSHGGWNWATGATFYWAMTRRGTGLGQLLLEFPALLVLSQWVVMVAEAVSPVVLFLRGRAKLAAIGFYLGFHLMTYLTIGIHFLPLVVCWLAFAPLERAPSLLRRPAASARSLIGGEVARRGSSGQPAPVRGDDSVPDVG
jgi:hypothetical protein